METCRHFVINYLTVGADILALENYRFREHLAVVAGGRFSMKSPGVAVTLAFFNHEFGGY